MKSITLLSILFLSACSIYKTEQTHPETNHVAKGNGIYYFLPKGQLHIIVKTVVTDTTKIKTPEQAIKKSITTENDNGKKVTKITQKYTKAEVPEVDQTSSESLSIKITASIEADGSKRYFLRHRPSSLSKDVVNVQTNKKGLLETANSTTTDETGTVVVNLVKLIGRIPVAFSDPSRVTEDPLPIKLDIDTWIDPSSKEDVGALIEKFKDTGYSLSISPTCPCPPSKGAPPAAPEVSKYGIAFKSPTAYVVEIKEVTPEEEPEGKSKFRKSYILPGGDVGIYKSTPKRGFLIEKTTNLTIVDGMLTGIAVTKPSELAAFTGLPITIMDAIISAFDGLVTIKVDSAKNETALLTEKVNQLKAEKELIQIRQDIIKLQNPAQE